MRPASLPSVEAFASRPHGTRTRYVSGCRCARCRFANRRYHAHRMIEIARGNRNGLVDAAPARARIVALGKQGMGKRQVAAAAGVPISTVCGVRAGRKRQIREQTARRILAVACRRAPGALVPAGPSWRMLDRLIADGYPKLRIARWLGQRRSSGLQLSRRFVCMQTARRVRALYDCLEAQRDPAQSRHAARGERPDHEQTNSQA